MITEQSAEINHVEEQLGLFRPMLGSRSQTFVQHFPSARFEYATAETLHSTIEKFTSKAGDIYWGINPPADGITNAVKDADIAYRAYVFIDIDAPDAHRERRLATDAEREQTTNIAKMVDGLLQKCGIDSAPIMIDSGNGTHLYYACNLPNDAESRALIKRLLDLLAELYGDAIDTCVFDARRIGRVPGTIHSVSGRMCRIITMPETNESVVSMDTLKAVVEELEMRAAAVRVETGDDAEPMEQTAKVLPFTMTATSGTNEDARRRAYGKEAISREIEKLANAPKRNVQLFKTVAALFELVAGGMATEAEVEAAIEEACTRNGLIDTESRKSSGTYQRARDRGMAKPRKMPPPRDQPRQPANVGTDATTETSGGDGGDATRNASDNKHNATDVKHLTDLGNAKRMVADHGKIIRYCFAWGKWLVWDGRRWKIDDTGYVMLLAKRTIMGLYGWAEAQLKLLANDDSPEAKLMAAKVKAVLDFAIKSEHANRLKAMVDLARSEPNIPITPGDLDRNPLAFNCENGTLFLRTLELKPHNQNDYITKLCHTRYVPSAKCPIFEKTIDGIFKKDAEVIRYVSRFTGYCLSGETREHVVPIAYGGGSNGKSLLLNLIIDCMGSDYAGTVPPELLMESAGNQHPTIKADLFGKRFMVAMETAEGARLNEQRIKALSGGDRIKARRCKEDFWEFDPTHKLILCTNHKPTVQGDDHGIWRRLALLPFVATYWDADKGETGDAEFKADKALPEKLRGEMEGILAWMVRGFEEWQRHGLPAPEAVRTATKEYRSDEDRITAFLEECCTRNTNQTVRTKTGELYVAYKRWCEQNGERWCTTNAFTRALAERGITRDTGRRWYECVALKPPDEAASTPTAEEQPTEDEPG